MSLRIVRSDITKLNTDAIVNSTDQYYSGGGRGVDYQIHQIGGEALREQLKKLPPLHLGEAKETDGCGLPCRYIIHTSGPRWTGESVLEAHLLGSCYRNSLQLADSLGCKSIAFPIICSNGKHFPKELALSMAVDSIMEVMSEYPDMDISLAVYGEWTEKIPQSTFDTITWYINSGYKPTYDYSDYLLYNRVGDTDACKGIIGESIDSTNGMEESTEDAVYFFEEPTIPEMLSANQNTQNEEPEDIDSLIADLIKNPTQKNLDRITVDEKFGEMLARKIEEKNVKRTDIQDEIEMSDVGFWKLLKGKNNPSKLTVFGIAIALHLSIDETREMMTKAGYAINPSSIQDIVLEGMISKGIYDRYTIDNVMYSLDLQLLPGAVVD